MIRILQVTDVLMQRSGITNVLMNYYRFIDKNRVQFDFYVNSAEENLVEEIKQMGGSVYFFPKLNMGNAGTVSKDIEIFISGSMNKYVAIHSHFYQMDFIIFKIAKKYGINHRIVHSHATAFALNNVMKSVRNRVLFTLGMPHTTDYFACGKEAGVFMFGKRRTETSKYYMLRNAIDASKFRYNEEIRKEIRREYGWENSYLIGIAARVSVRKNQIYLVELMPELLRKQPNAKLIIMGDGEELGTLKEKVKRLFLEGKVIFLGTVSNVADFLQALDCFALPSYFEGLPLSVVEAETSGLKCVVSNFVTKEVVVDGLCKHVALENRSAWIDALIEDKEYNRVDKYDRIVEWGYSLEVEAERLAKKYESMVM